MVITPTKRHPPTGDRPLRDLCLQESHGHQVVDEHGAQRRPFAMPVAGTVHVACALCQRLQFGSDVEQQRDQRAVITPAFIKHQVTFWYGEERCRSRLLTPDRQKRGAYPRERRALHGDAVS
jgi:hypothetical protein